MNQSYPSSSDTERRTCLISPIGCFKKDLIEHVGKQIGDTFGYQPSVISLLNDIGFAYNRTRNQYHSTSILEKLSSFTGLKAEKIVVLTKEDLFIPILTHVYGEAQLCGRSCIVSICRLNEELDSKKQSDIFFNRTAKEVLHELGHTFGLTHCKDRTCIMHYCRSIRDVDRKSIQLCRYCRILLKDQLK
ncbi:MAG: archaemetzincin family Zn-dependent metalloprotease [Deltaproteobacteria bacterium]|jgi:archaemetzincin|nr:archaemetzincin family Zn-dependent metalloprotease [Deltaproteobacteria bacterium]MBT4265851.1 archaemetzincin family Zn-dependent metalloprotease [Deltaproteobacteria bacterium]MBT4642852.1 archaemetzincin family Zn-dependent metalloprotease [Deltaproteobacteria bacterium]MBT6504134.1 archaemetzincin family Zn-dependent metalloprotease [Deltaproteobacteria bacterium]MBT6612147.1 archaemetzincin family Zn-dependent metalloprotease [Deltaproteobacteria bacterium]